jgi:acetate kinase
VVADQADESAHWPAEAHDHGAAVTQLLKYLESRPELARLSAIGHRIVHGGPRYSSPQRLDTQMLEALGELRPYDPEHLPQELQLAKSCQRRFPDLPQVACFDTAFHHDMPRVAQLLPLPRRYQRQGLRRYGFHGLSYTYLLQQLERVGGAEAAYGRVVLAHLGSGASLAAVLNGRSIDTSMAFTPAAGIPMSTRSGDLDPGLAWYLARTEKLDARGFNHLVNSESGLLGISETSADMRELLRQEAHDERAHDAVELFCYQVRKWIGAFSAALGGLDTLVFAGGIGERAAPVRARVCAGLAFLGLTLDASLNDRHAPLISTPQSRVAVRVIATDEEQIMAQQVRAVLWSKH